MKLARVGRNKEVEIIAGRYIRDELGWRHGKVLEMAFRAGCECILLWQDDHQEKWAMTLYMEASGRWVVDHDALDEEDYCRNVSGDLDGENRT